MPPPPPQILIYNLPESIRESDLEKLSFAVELSKAFYLPAEPKAVGAVNGSNAVAAVAAASDEGSGDAGVAPIQPGNMVWLIQRDFLQVRELEEAGYACLVSDDTVTQHDWHLGLNRQGLLPLPLPLPLQGKSLEVTLGDALRPVPNPQSDPAIAQLNRIRWVALGGGMEAAD